MIYEFVEEEGLFFEVDQATQHTLINQSQHDSGKNQNQSKEIPLGMIGKVEKDNNIPQIQAKKGSQVHTKKIPMLMQQYSKLIPKEVRNDAF